MKKALLASTAIVAAAALASPANAADRVKLSLGGFMEQYVGFADNEEDAARDFAAFDQQNDNEIYFSGSTTLDNGIKIAVRMELEGDAGAAGNMDEAWMDIQTAWGTLRMGEDDAVNDLQAVEPQSGISDDYNQWVTPVGVSANDDSYVTSGDDNVVLYLSPKIAGFQFGASYTPEVGDNTDTISNRVTDNSSALSATLNWSGKFGDFGIDTGYGYYHEGGDGSRINSDFTSHNFGLNVNIAGFGIGGNYGRFLGNPAVAPTSEGRMWQAGIWYVAGPMAVGFLHKDQEFDGATGDAGARDENTLNSLWFNYTISDGVKWESMIFHADYDEEANVDATENSGGWGVVGGLRLDF